MTHAAGYGSAEDFVAAVVVLRRPYVLGLPSDLVSGELIKATIKISVSFGVYM